MLLLMMILMMATVMNCDFSFTAHTLFCNTVDPLIMKREGILVNAGIDWLTELRFYVSLDTKWVISEMFFPANLLAKYWRWMLGTNIFGVTWGMPLTLKKIVTIAVFPAKIEVYSKFMEKMTFTYKLIRLYLYVFASRKCHRRHCVCSDIARWINLHWISSVNSVIQLQNVVARI